MADNVIKNFWTRFRRGRKRSVSPQQTLGHMAAVIFAGYIQQEERSQELVSHERRYRLFTNMLVNCSIVGAAVYQFLLHVGSAEWEVVAADDDVDGMYAELTQAALMDDPKVKSPWHRVVRRAAMFKFYGFSMAEWVMRRRPDGWFGFDKIVPRGQATIERWDVEGGEVMGVAQEIRQTEGEVYLPRHKLLYLVDDSISDSPQGLGLFRHLVEPVRRLERYEQLEGFAYETDLSNIPYLRAPLSLLQAMVDDENEPDFTQSDMNKILKPLQEMMQKHIRDPESAILLDSAVYENEGESGGAVSSVPMYGIELLKSGATSFADVAKAIERINREIARLLGVEHLLLGGDGVGSFALSKDKTDTFRLTINSTLVDVKYACEADLIGSLWRVNGWPEEMKPSLKVKAVDNPDFKETAEGLRALALAGAPVEQEDEAIDTVRDMAGLPRRDAVGMDGDRGMMDDDVPEMTEEGDGSMGDEGGDE